MYLIYPSGYFRCRTADVKYDVLLKNHDIQVTHIRVFEHSRSIKPTFLLQLTVHRSITISMATAVLFHFVKNLLPKYTLRIL